MVKESWLSAEDVRVSKRSYTPQMIEPEKLEMLKQLIHHVNTTFGVNAQLVENCHPLFEGFKASYGLLKGAHTCIALIGHSTTPTNKIKVGYAGEMLVLEATALGLGSCWIGGTYHKKVAKQFIPMKEHESILCLIAIGYNPQNMHFVEKMVSYANRKTKSPESFLHSTKEVPNWVKEGLSSVAKAPSALNAQPVGYGYEDDKVTAFTTHPNHDFEEIDLGISMLHFEIGAKKQHIEGEWLFEMNPPTFKIAAAH